jgi:hypothetical protein
LSCLGHATDSRLFHDHAISSVFVQQARPVLLLASTHANCQHYNKTGKPAFLANLASWHYSKAGKLTSVGTAEESNFVQSMQQQSNHQHA